MEPVLVSACLLGRACRYDGGDRMDDALKDSLAASGARAIGFCPEEEGGLPTPRPAAVIEGGDGEAVARGAARVLTMKGHDITAPFLEGAHRAVAAAQAEGCRVAYLKERSPSCGCASVGDVPGCGVTTALLRQAGIATISVQ